VLCSWVYSIGLLEGRNLYITFSYFLTLLLSSSLLTQRLVYTHNTYVPLIVIDHERSLELIHSP